jgi:hypothetical protein
MIRRSSELDDNEGRVFIAYVPDAPFGVLGRRGDGGQLYVGQTFAKKGGIPFSDIREVVDKNRIELITGPEAEALIREVFVEHIAENVGASVMSVERHGNGYVAALKLKPRQ